MSHKAYALKDMNPAERLIELFRRLQAAPPCGSAGEALELVASVLNAVEDEVSGRPRDPTTPLNDGRMYPPQEDMRIDVSPRTDIRGYRTRRHYLYLSETGAILITERVGTCLFRKPDRAGRTIELSRPTIP